jgi:hypothetical protein
MSFAVEIPDNIFAGAFDDVELPASDGYVLGWNNAASKAQWYAIDNTSAHVVATTVHGATGVVAGTTNAQTLSNKTLTAPVIATQKPASDGTSAWRVTKADGSTPVLTVDTTNTRLGIGNTPSQALEVTGNTKLSGSLIAPSWKPASDSTTALLLQNSSGTAVVTVDTTNGRLGIGVTPNNKLDVAGTVQMDGLRIDVTPTFEVVVCTYSLTISLNGTNYKIPCVAA